MSTPSSIRTLTKLETYQYFLESLDDRTGLIGGQYLNAFGECCVVGSAVSKLLRQEKPKQIEREEMVTPLMTFDLGARLKAIEQNDTEYINCTPQQRLVRMRVWLKEQINGLNQQPVAA
jgi:hypothetical protein